MKVLNEKPPIYDKAKAAFGFNEKTTIFTYGDTIYNPGCINVSLDLHAHEEVHERQQAAMKTLMASGPKNWWKRYIKDSHFRFAQELEAYQAQYRFVSKTIKDRNQLNKYLTAIAGELKGPMYGDLRIGGLFEVMAMIRDNLSPQEALARAFPTQEHGTME